MIPEALRNLEKHIRSSQYKGFDPYDGLTSPLFKLSILRSNKWLRFGFQQFLKRFPFNLRPIFGIGKQENPVTLGLCIQAYTYLLQAEPERKAELLKEIDYLLDRLETTKAPGFKHTCWGYPFDWEARYARIPAWQPTIVATGIITHALFECYQLTGNERCREWIISAAHFVQENLNRVERPVGYCFSYSPFDKQAVLNASLKAVRLLAQTYALCKEDKWLKLAEPALQYALSTQQADGSFAYSDKRKAVDLYHTGYVLDCLDEWEILSGNSEYREAKNKGFDYFKAHFFTEDDQPKFYHNKKFPLDCTAAGQAQLTLCRFEEVEKAERVARQVIHQMQKTNGSFRFRKYCLFTNSISYMRWSDAWMMVGLAKLYVRNQKFSPVRGDKEG